MLINAYNQLDPTQKNNITFTNLVNFLNPYNVGSKPLIAQWVLNCPFNANEFEWLCTQGAGLTGSMSSHNDNLLHICLTGLNLAALKAVCEKLNKTGALQKELESKNNTRQDTPLRSAVRSGSLEAIRLLLEFDNRKHLPVDMVLECKVLLSAPLILPVQKKRIFEFFEKNYFQDKAVWTPANSGTLLKATIESDYSIDFLEYLLKKIGKDFAFKDESGNTLLHYAAQGSRELVKYLVEEKQLSLVAKNKDEQRPIDITPNNYNVIVRLKADLVNYAKTGQNKPDYFSATLLKFEYGGDEKGTLYDSYTLLHYAAEMGRFDVISDIYTVLHRSNALEAWEQLVNQPITKTGGERTPLGIAVRQKKTRAIQYLLENGANPDICCVIDKKESKAPCTPFAFAIAVGNREIVALFLNYSKLEPNLNQRNDWKNGKNYSLLDLAFEFNELSIASNIAEGLVRAGIDLTETKGQGTNPLLLKFKMMAPDENKIWKEVPVYEHFKKILLGDNPQALIDFLEGINNPTWLKVTDNSGFNAVHLLAQAGKVDTLTALLNAHPGIVKPLLTQENKKTDRTPKEAKTDRTPLHCAVAEKQTAMVDFLLSQENVKQEINARDCDGNTVFHLVVEQDSPDLLKMLRAAGANSQIKNKAGKLPKDMNSSFWNKIGLASNALQTEEEDFKDAVKADNLDEVKKFYSNESSYFEKDPAAILKLAAEQGAVQVFQYLGEIAIGFDKENKNKNYESCIKDLIENTYSLENRPKLLVQCLAKKAHWHLAEWYSKYGSFDRRGLTRYREKTPLLIAVKRGNVDGVKTLIKYTSLYFINMDSYQSHKHSECITTPLVTSFGADAITELLLVNGADTAKQYSTPDYEYGGYKSCYPHQTMLGGYLVRKAKLIETLFRDTTFILDDYDSFRKTPGFDCNSLKAFYVTALSISKELKLSRSTPNDYQAVCINTPYKNLFTQPFETLEENVNKLTAAHNSYQTQRAKIVKQAIEPAIKTFNEVAVKHSRHYTLHAEIETLLDVFGVMLHVAAKYHNEHIVPIFKAFEAKEGGRDYIVSENFNYKTLSTDTVQKIIEGANSMGEKFTKFETHLQTAKRQIHLGQKNQHSKLATDIKTFVESRAMLEDAGQLSNQTGFLGTSTLGADTRSCADAINALVGFEENNKSTPTAQQLIANKNALETLKEKLVYELEIVTKEATKITSTKIKEEKATQAAEKKAKRTLGATFNSIHSRALKNIDFLVKRDISKDLKRDLITALTYITPLVDKTEVDLDKKLLEKLEVSDENLKDLERVSQEAQRLVDFITLKEKYAGHKTNIDSFQKRLGAAEHYNSPEKLPTHLLVLIMKEKESSWFSSKKPQSLNDKAEPCLNAINELASLEKMAILPTSQHLEVYKKALDVLDKQLGSQLSVLNATYASYQQEQDRNEQALKEEMDRLTPQNIFYRPLLLP